MCIEDVKDIHVLRIRERLQYDVLILNNWVSFEHKEGLKAKEKG
jgi:hypothetical protein